MLWTKQLALGKRRSYGARAGVLRGHIVTLHGFHDVILKITERAMEEQVEQ